MPNATPEERKKAIEEIGKKYKKIESIAIGIKCTAEDIYYKKGLYSRIPEDCPLLKNNLSSRALQVLEPLTILPLLQFYTCEQLEKRELIFTEPVVYGQSCLDLIEERKEKVCEIDPESRSCRVAINSFGEIQKYIKRNPVEKALSAEERALFKEMWDWETSLKQNR